MHPLVVVVAVGGAWCVLSVLAALWLAQLLRPGGRAGAPGDLPLTGEPAELPRV